MARFEQRLAAVEAAHRAMGCPCCAAEPAITIVQPGGSLESPCLVCGRVRETFTLVRTRVPAAEEGA